MTVDIMSNVMTQIEVVDQMARDVINGVAGVSTNSLGTTIHLTEPTTSNREGKANKILDNWGDLTVTADKTTMSVGDVAPIITVNSATTDVGYAVLLDGTLYSSGTTPVIAGVATLILTSPEAGTYDIYIYRRSGSLMSGMVTIVVSES